MTRYKQFCLPLLFLFSALLPTRIVAQTNFKPPFKLVEDTKLIYNVEPKTGGEYTFTVSVLKLPSARNGEIVFDWAMGAPVNKQGTVMMTSEALKSATSWYNYFSKKEVVLENQTSVFVSEAISDQFVDVSGFEVALSNDAEDKTAFIKQEMTNNFSHSTYVPFVKNIATRGTVSIEDMIFETEDGKKGVRLAVSAGQIFILYLQTNDFKIYLTDIEQPEYQFSTPLSEKLLKATISLKMPEGEGSSSAAVAWNPKQQKYYAAMAGNENFPMAVFDAKGKRLSEDKMTARADVRGMWYNPKDNVIQANCYGGINWVQYRVNDRGMPEVPTIFVQKSDIKDNGVAIYDYNQHQLYANIAPNYYTFNLEGKKTGSLSQLVLPDESNVFSHEVGANYNPMFAYTGQTATPFAFLNYVTRRVEFLDNNAQIKRRFKLPNDAPVNDNFCFSIANNLIWLFDKETRTWKGYAY